MPERARKGATLSVRLRIVNDGYGRMYNTRPVELVLQGAVRRAVAIDADARRWAPGMPVDLCVSMLVPDDVPAGSYRIGVSLPDAAPTLRADSRYAVRLSNGVEWDEASGTNLLAPTVTIEN